MNVDELRRRLMTDPAACRGEAERARAEGGEAERLVAESEAFERLLDEAMDVPVRDGLAQQLRQTPFRAGRAGRTLPGPAGWLAIAASLTLAVAVTVFALREVPTSNPVIDARIAEHLDWHWHHDGAEVLATALASPTEPDRVRALLDGFGVRLAPELLADVRLSKICPTPDGAGAHLVLATADGPVTLYYMPRTRVPGSGETYPLADGMQALVFNVDHGSVALLAEAGRDLPALSQRIANRLVFPEERTL